MGKTRLALEYAWCHIADYRHVFFMTAESPSELQFGLSALGSLIGSKLPPTTPVFEQVEEVLSWLSSHNDWLLIIDNVDREDASAAVEELLPRLSNGHVLVTSRYRRWGDAVASQGLDSLSVSDAVRYLLQRTAGTRLERKQDRGDAEKLAQDLAGRLGFLPLALEMAAAYIERWEISIHQYLGEWDKAKRQLLNWHDATAAANYPLPVAVTFDRSFESLSLNARAVLRVCAWMVPDPIPCNVIEAGGDVLDEVAAMLADELDTDIPALQPGDVLEELSAFSMIRRTTEGTSQEDSFTIHRLVQEVVKNQIPASRRREWVSKTLELVAQFEPQDLSADDVRSWKPFWEPMRPHLVILLAEGDRRQIEDPVVDLMNGLGLHLLEKAQFADAELWLRRSLEIREQTFGPDDPGTALGLNNLASLLQATKRLDEAEPMMRRALQIDEASFGPDHPNVARDLNNLATLLQATNRLDEAESMMRRALQIGEASFGPDHPDVARNLNNLATLLQATNRLVEAEPMMRRALQIDEASFGPDHPNVAICLNNLAQLLQDTNRLDEAEPMMRRALKIDEASFGPDHPNVAIDLGNLGSLLQTKGKPEDGRELLERALAIFENSFGPDHLYLLEAKRRLASFD